MIARQRVADRSIGIPAVKERIGGGGSAGRDRDHGCDAHPGGDRRGDGRIGHGILTVKVNQPIRFGQLVTRPGSDRRDDGVEQSRSHGRLPVRALHLRPVPAGAPVRGFPSDRQIVAAMRERSAGMSSDGSVRRTSLLAGQGLAAAC